VISKVLVSVTLLCMFYWHQSDLLDQFLNYTQRFTSLTEQLGHLSLSFRKFLSVLNNDLLVDSGEEVDEVAHFHNQPRVLLVFGVRNDLVRFLQQMLIYDVPH
jgi:hypothetical protein